MPRTDDEKVIAEISAIARKVWRPVLAGIPGDQLICIYGEPEIYQILHAAIAEGLDSETACEFLIKPFCDEINDQTYQIYLEEIRDFVASDRVVDTSLVPHLAFLNKEINKQEQQVKDLQAKQLKRRNRELNIRGQKGLAIRTPQIILQDELGAKFGARDTAGFHELLRMGKVEVARNWLQYIVDNKERYFYYHDDWDRWLSHRQDELKNAGAEPIMV